MMRDVDLGGRRLRLPFFYGWIIIAVAFVTMAVGVNVRTSYSLLFPPLLDEFGWGRGVTAGAFSFGFLVSAMMSPFIGRLMDRRGPRVVVELGVVLTVLGLFLVTVSNQPWQIYLTLGVLVGAGTNCMGYTAHALFLPNWFVRWRGLATAIAYAGVGVGAIILLPWVQVMIAQSGWRAACVALGVLVLVLLGPANLLLRHRPDDLGLQPDGAAATSGLDAPAQASNVADPTWAAVDWTLRRAMRTYRFWWVAAGYFAAMYVWYAVQVHQTKYLVEIGFNVTDAAWALGLVSLVAIPGQVALGHLSDRVGREWVWSAGCLGFVICCLALLLLRQMPTPPLLYLMVGAQGLLGYGLTAVIGAITAELFEGRHHGAILGAILVAAIAGGAVGAWLTGALYDVTGSYRLAFWIAIAVSLFSAIAIWLAAPRKVRVVAGQIHRLKSTGRS